MVLVPCGCKSECQGLACLEPNSSSFWRRHLTPLIEKVSDIGKVRTTSHLASTKGLTSHQHQSKGPTAWPSFQQSIQHQTTWLGMCQNHLVEIWEQVVYYPISKGTSIRLRSPCEWHELSPVMIGNWFFEWGAYKHEWLSHGNTTFHWCKVLELFNTHCWHSPCCSMLFCFGVAFQELVEVSCHFLFNKSLKSRFFECCWWLFHKPHHDTWTWSPPQPWNIHLCWCQRLY